MIKSESNLNFDFIDQFTVTKFDDTRFYTNYFKALPGGKGVDFIVDAPNTLLLMEIKNCSGNEHDNHWRLATDNAKVLTAPTTVETEDRESLDVEVSKKVAMTLSCLIGSYSKSSGCESAIELVTYFRTAISSNIRNGSKDILVMLFLEGNFGSQTRTKKMIMQRIQDSINKKLKWLNCKVKVVDSTTYDSTFFSLV